MTDLVVHQPAAPSAVMTDNEINATFRLANALSMSGFFKDARQAEQAFAKILFGRDLGLSPTQAMTSIHIVEGKPELSANLQATLVRTYRGSDGERYDYAVQRLDDEACEIAFSRNGDPIGSSTFSMADAQKAGLAGKGVWQKYPRNMLFARAMSNGVAFHCPEVTGGVRVYSEGEIGGEEKPPQVDVVQPLPPTAPDRQGDLGDALPWEPPATTPEPEDAEVVDPMDATITAEFAADILGESKRRLQTVGQFRNLVAGVGIEPPDDLRSAEKRLAVIQSFTTAQAIDFAKALQQIPAQAEEAAA